MAIQKCPICEGHGSVAGGFYMTVAGQETWVSNKSMEICRTCGGKGTVETKDKEQPGMRSFFPEIAKIKNDESEVKDPPDDGGPTASDTKEE